MKIKLFSAVLFFVLFAGCVYRHSDRAIHDDEFFSAEPEKTRTRGVASVGPSRLFLEDLQVSQFKLGAAWSSQTRRKISLVVALDSKSGYGTEAVGLTGVDIEIAGRKYSYAVSAPTIVDQINYAAFSDTIHTARDNFIVIPYSTYKKMMRSNDCTIRIHTKTSSEVVQFSIEQGPDEYAGAKVFFRHFDAMLQSVR